MGGRGFVQLLLFEIIIVARPPPGEKKKVIIIGRPPLRRKKVIIIQHPPAPLTGSGSYFCLSSRFRELVLSLISSTAVFLCIEIRFLRLLNVFLGAFSASESVSEFLDAVLSFFTAVCVQFLLFEIIIVARPPPAREKKSNNNWPPPPFEEKK